MESFKEKGYQTTFIAGHDITGPRRNYERGASMNQYMILILQLHSISN